MIQSVISRQASNSFIAKGWALTASLALYGFAVEKDRAGLALLGLLSVTVFWVLDAYFLRQERLFRCLYNAAIAEDGSVPLFSMDTSPFVGMAKVRLGSCAKSVTVSALYGVLAIAGVVVLVSTPATTC